MDAGVASIPSRGAESVPARAAGVTYHRKAVARRMPSPDTAVPSKPAASPRATVLAGMAWMIAGGLLLLLMNALMKWVATDLPAPQAMFLRYVFGLAAMLPLFVRDGRGLFRTAHPAGQMWRGAVHAGALLLFFIALPHVPLADMTAIQFTAPLFVLLGAALVLRERVSAARWVAAAAGLTGVAVVLWPHLSGGAGGWALVLLAATPLFAASSLITKALTRHDSPNVIVAWQNVTVTLWVLPIALWLWRAPTGTEWLLLAVCGALGSAAHWAMARGLQLADISALQPLRFLDLVWSSLLGLVMFGDAPTVFTFAGGALIVASTIWIARHESRGGGGPRG